MGKILRILVVEDSEDDLLLLVRNLKQSGIEPVTRRVETAEALRAALDAFQWDVILCDVSMPQLDALGALAEVKSAGFDIPFIIVSGSVPEDQLVALMKAGAHDIIVKDRLSRLAAAIEREVEDAAVRRQRRHVENQLRVAIESISEGFILFDAQDRLVICNETYKRIYDSSAESIVPGATFEDIIRCGAERGQCEQALGRVEAFVRERLALHRACGGAFEQTLTDGRCILIDERRTRDGGTVGTHTDITALKTAERNLRDNEAFLRLIADNLPILVAYFDTDGRYRFVNRTGIEWYDRPAEAIIGQTIEEVLGPRAFESFRPYHERVRQGAEQHFDTTAAYPNGVTRDVHAAYVPDRGPDGKIRGFVAMVADITERVVAERALATSEEQFRSAFETAPHGMALLALDGGWLKVNRAVTEMLGYEERELLALDFQTVTHPDDLATDLDLVRRVLTGDLPSYQLEKRYVRKDGGVVWALSSAALVRESGGTPLYFIAQMIDISARKRAEQERARLENELRHAQKMESLGTLSGGIAHEFNNMLLPISGLLELSLDGVADSPDIYENLEKALENARRAAALVDRILTFSRVDNCALARTNVASAIDEAVALLCATVPATVQIFKELDDIGDAYIDKAQISQIVMNLGVNATHAIGDGVGRIEFRLKAETVRRHRVTVGGRLLPGRYARLSVQDTGCGMDEGTIARIFEPFFTTKAVGKGTGMGLAFVHGVIKNHGGVIDVKSRPGAGTTFDLFVPFERAARSPARNSAAA